MRDDHCDCPKFGVSCMVITKVPEGVFIQMDWDCMSLEILRQKEERCSNLKHTLAKGGVYDDCKECIL
jgi:hypothetical protein